MNLPAARNRLWFWLIFSLLLLWRWWQNPAAPALTEIVEPGQALFTLALFLQTVFCAWGLGWRLLAWLAPASPRLSGLEAWSLSGLLGLGSLGTILFGLGMAGWFQPTAFVLLLTVCGLLAVFAPWPLISFRQSRFFTRPSLLTWSAFALTAGIFILTLGTLFLPVWNYDALSYHLTLPQSFLETGRIYFEPQLFRSAHPLLMEMLFSLGLAFGAASFAKLIHFTFALLLTLSLYAFARRWFDARTAWLSLLLWLGMPSVWLWASWANVDFAWAAFEFWTVYALLLWREQNSTRWLVLAGLMAGFGLAVKYLSAVSFGLAALLLAWMLLRERKISWREAARLGLAFFLPAGLAAGGWYLKNWLWTGNPLYPLLFGGLGWDAAQNALLNDYLYTFGFGWQAVWRLPLDLYLRHNAFSTITIETIHPALWLGFFAPLLWRKLPAAARLAWAYSGIYFLIWALNAPQVRFTLPFAPWLLVFAAAVIMSLPRRLEKPLSVLLAGGMLLFSLFYQVGDFAASQTGAYLSAKISAAQVLSARFDNFSAHQFLFTLPPESRTQLLWDGRDYYCAPRCLPDHLQALAVLLAQGSPPPQQVAATLRQRGITHLLLSLVDVWWFEQYHDPRGLHAQALAYFENVFLPQCAREIYRDESSRIYELTCP